MIKYAINNIRELVGHKVNLQMVYDSPVCRLESWAALVELWMDIPTYVPVLHPDKTFLHSW